VPSRKPKSLASIAGAPWLSWPETRAVFAALAARGFVARAVGGSVRNTLLGEPVGDVDLATTAPPQTVIELAEAASLTAVPTGIDHGTVTLVAGERGFEVTTLRCDVKTHGRHATVAFTEDWEEDARRRDFTINALYADADGTLFDPIGGYPDILARRVRFIGDPAARIREDYLRILRFFRINAQFGRPPYCRQGLDACVRERAGLARLSAERVRAELLRLLAAPGAEPALGAMYDYGLLPLVLGGVPVLERFRGLVRVETELGAKPDALRRLFALGVCVEEDVARLARRLKLSNAEIRRLEALYPARDLARSVGEREAKALLYRSGPDVFADIALLAMAGAGDRAVRDAWRGLCNLPSRWQAPAFPLSGGDLVALGAARGPGLGEIMSELERGWIERDFAPDRDALLALARSLIEAPASDRRGEPA